LKKVEAIITIFKLEVVKEDLNASGVTGMIISEVTNECVII
jgi:nitrogen regulatory protein PII